MRNVIGIDDRGMRHVATAGVFCLLCGGTGWSLAGQSSSQPAGAATVTTTKESGASDSYTVVNLGPGGPTNDAPVINRRGQIAFSISWGTPGGWFFDGDMIKSIAAPGGVFASPTGLNDAGQVSGYAATGEGGNFHAFIWTEAGGMRLLEMPPTPASDASQARGINTTGQIAGFAFPFDGPLHAFMWSDSQGKVDLGSLTNGWSSASAINDQGVVVGSSIAAGGQAHAFRWAPASGLVDLGTIGGVDSVATHINQAGQIAGYAGAPGSVPGTDYHGFVWNADTGMVDIGTIGGGKRSGINAMNDKGQVVGWSLSPCGYHAISWTRRSGITDLGTPCGAFSSAFAINKHGHIVGAMGPSLSPEGYRAFLWTAGHGFVDLNKKIPKAPAGLLLTQASAISDKGEIVVSSNAGLVLLKPGQKGTDSPVLGPIMGSDRVALGTPASFSVSFTDQNPRDTHTAQWTWSDATPDNPGTVNEAYGAGTVNGSHTFASAGYFTVLIRLTDSTGRSTKVSRNIEVYVP